MSMTVPTTEPTAVRAGDTWAWTRALYDYPAPGWALTYTLFSRVGVITIVAAADVTLHSVSVAPSTTANYTAGRYDWVAHVSDGTDRYQVGSGVLTILPDLGATARAATLATGSVADDNALTWTAVSAGATGNTIAINLIQRTGADIPLGVMVLTSASGTVIRATLATDNSGDPATTALELAAAIAASSAAAALVTCTQGAGSAGTGLVAALAQTNLAGGTSAPATYDGRSHARRMLDAIDAMLEGRASDGDLDVMRTITGDRSTWFDGPTLLKLRQQYAAAVAAEDASDRLARGEPSGRFISTRFLG